MREFIASADQSLLERHDLAGFDELWDLQLDAMDEPGPHRGSWSSTYRLELEGKGFYLKRQSNCLIRSLRRPFGESSFAREFRNIRRYQNLAIPVLQVVYFGERRVAGQTQAILLTRALDGWDDLDGLLAQWPQLAAGQRQAILKACGQLARTLHGAGQVHGCLQPRHIFLRARAGAYQAQFLDLEKTRPLLFGQRDLANDLEPLLRRTPIWSEADIRLFLAAYLEQAENSSLVDAWVQRLTLRRGYKEAR